LFLSFNFHNENPVCISLLPHLCHMPWTSSFISHLTPPRERGYIAHWIGGWVGLRAILDLSERRKILPPPESERMVVQTMACMPAHSVFEIPL
jgi:hypothetical protein